MRITCGGVLFDLDGVLVDSTPAVARVWTGWAREHGLEPEDVVRRAHGRPSIETLREVLPDADHEAMNRDVERREMEDVEDVVALPGAVEILRALPASRWAIVTSGTRPLAEIRIRAAGLPEPKHLITASDVQRGKPNPDPYLKGAESLRIRPSECLVVEDAAAGVQAGKAAGARVIAVRTTMPEEELRSAGADWVVVDCAALSVQGAPSNGLLSLAIQAAAWPK